MVLTTAKIFHGLLIAVVTRGHDVFPPVVALLLCMNDDDDSDDAMFDIRASIDTALI